MTCVSCVACIYDREDLLVPTISTTSLPLLLSRLDFLFAFAFWLSLSFSLFCPFASPLASYVNPCLDLPTTLQLLLLAGQLRDYVRISVSSHVRGPSFSTIAPEELLSPEELLAMSTPYPCSLCRTTHTTGILPYIYT